MIFHSYGYVTVYPLIQEDQECRKLTDNAKSESFDETSTVDMEKEPSEHKGLHVGVSTCYKTSVGEEPVQKMGSLIVEALSVQLHKSLNYVQEKETVHHRDKIRLAAQKVSLLRDGHPTYVMVQMDITAQTSDVQRSLTKDFPCNLI